jgi:hypothetical protein
MSESNIPNKSGLTYKKVLRFIQENAKKSREEYLYLKNLLEESGKLSDKRFEEFAEIKELFKETREQMKEADGQIREQMKETDKRMRETAERIKETDEQIDKMCKRVDKTNAELGKLGLRFGEMVEHLVAAGVAERFNELGYHFHGISSGNFKAKNEKGETLAEVDVLLENDDCYVAVEVKSKPNMEDVLEHINRLKVLRQYFKEHNREKKVIGALAGAVFADNVKIAVINRGLYPIVQSGDTITIDIPKGFKPRLF